MSSILMNHLFKNLVSKTVLQINFVNRGIKYFFCKNERKDSKYYRVAAYKFQDST